MTRNGFLTYILDEVLREIAGISYRAMFGGYSLYKDGKIFGMIANDTLYFKSAVSDKPFTYTIKGKTHAMKYYEVPEKIMSNTEEIAVWVNKSLTV